MARMNVDFMARQMPTAFVKIEKPIPIPHIGGMTRKTYGSSCLDFPGLDRHGFKLVPLSSVDDQLVGSTQNRGSWLSRGSRAAGVVVMSGTYVHYTQSYSGQVLACTHKRREYDS